jgi:hypothetical protein
MADLTRRDFIARSAIGAGALAGAGSMSELLAQTQSGCSITSNFNGTRINGGDYIWFSSVMKVQGLGSDPVSISSRDLRFCSPSTARLS